MKTRKGNLKCLLISFIICYLLVLISLMIFLFSSKKNFCDLESEKMSCPSDNMWKFLKIISIGGAAVVLLKLILACRLYQSVKEHNAKEMDCILKVIVLLFVINSLVTLFLKLKDVWCALVEIGVGSLITLMFVWYTHA